MDAGVVVMFRACSATDGAGGWVFMFASLELGIEGLGREVGEL